LLIIKNTVVNINCVLNSSIIFITVMLYLLCKLSQLLVTRPVLFALEPSTWRRSEMQKSTNLKLSPYLLRLFLWLYVTI